MNWLDIILSHLPTIILVIAAFFFFGAEVIKTMKVWRDKKQEVIDGAVAEKTEKQNIQNEFVDLHAKIDNILTILKDTNKRIDSGFERIAGAEDKISMLIKSDIDDIKSWIVEKYLFFFCKQGWVDEFSMDTINKRFADYDAEGGNSYIEGLVHQIRSLPRSPEEKAQRDKLSQH